MAHSRRPVPYTRESLRWAELIPAGTRGFGQDRDAGAPTTPHLGSDDPSSGLPSVTGAAGAPVPSLLHGQSGIKPHPFGCPQQPAGHGTALCRCPEQAQGRHAAPGAQSNHSPRPAPLCFCDSLKRNPVSTGEPSGGFGPWCPAPAQGRAPKPIFSSSPRSTPARGSVLVPPDVWDEKKQLLMAFPPSFHAVLRWSAKQPHRLFFKSCWLPNLGSST